MIDNIFGNLLDPDQLLAYHRERMRGVKHLYDRDPLDPLPGKPLTLRLTTAGPGIYDSVRCAFTLDGSDPGSPAAEIISAAESAVTWDTVTCSYIHHWVVTLPLQPAGTLIRYRLEARQALSDKWVSADATPESPHPSYALWVDDDPPPSWSRDAMIYQVFPDRFYPGDGRTWNRVSSLNDIYGGTLQGVIDKLDYIRSLGFNTIWLNPFFKTASHHGYNASDYYTVEPRLGTNADLQELINKAHALGIRLILDFVANHWSKDHFTFQDAQKHEQNRYHDWYIWKNWPDDYACYFNVRELPQINLQNPEARAYMLDVARHWLRQGFDGYRLDYAYGPPHDFWVDFRRACREIKPDCWIFGEIIHTVPMLLSYTGIMDGTLDFHLTRALRETFALDNIDLEQFETFLSGHEAYFPASHIRPSFLDNHDEARFLHLAGDDKSRLRLAALVMYTLQGPPIVYCGTETGLSQERPMYQNGRNIFEETRLPMNWETADPELQEYFCQLNTLRRDHPALRTGSRRLLALDPTEGTYAYARESKDQAVIVALNTSRVERTILLNYFGYAQSVDILFNSDLQEDGNSLKICLAPRSGAIVLCNREN